MTVSRSLVAAYFDPGFYVARYEDVKASGCDPLEHYLDQGFRERRDPAPWFSTAQYRATHVVADDEDAFLHFLASDRQSADSLRELAGMRAPPTVSERRNTLVQPFYALQPQVAGDSAVVFTSIAGLKHMLPSNTTQHPDQRVYCDVPVDQPGWSFHPALYWDADPKIAILFHKYCIASFFSNGTRLIWVDSRVSLQTSAIERLLALLEDADLAVFRHYERDCVYDELGAIVRAGRASFRECRDYERYLTNLGFGSHAGLYETGVLGIRVSEQTRRAMRRVFGLCKRYIPRDQVVLPPILATANLKVVLFNEGQTHLRNSPGVFVRAW